MDPLFHAILAAIAVSLCSLVCIVPILLLGKRTEKAIPLLVGLAIGALVGGAFFHLIPEAFGGHEGHAHEGASHLMGYAVAVGIFLFFIMERGLHWRHRHVVHEHDAEGNHPIHPVGWMNLMSDATHNFVDGAIIAAAFMTDFRLGVATAIAAAIHEIPQELGDFGVLLHSGFSKGRAVLANLACALMAVIGVVAFYFLGSHVEHATEFMMPIAAGGFIYIAIADLMPELNRRYKDSLYLPIVGIMLGLAAMVVMGMFE